MTTDREIIKLIVNEYHRLKVSNPRELSGDKLWGLATKYVKAQISADWLIFQSNHNIGVFK